ncbi:gamma-glutamyltransferase [Psychroflexus tropicus]|uniref:gamma-glutamyltransferase n=1 Tax=Psychroflexus tropicus TaxID=197345 RepID=UPI0003736E41|nr:gamma-glutamyltransferase [Psychroflexus tropicus]
MLKFSWSCVIFITLSIGQSCSKKDTAQHTHSSKTTIADSAMVVSARKEASEIGLQILKDGGNAFDAMVATEMALAVCYPFAGNLGGGGFMVYRTNDGATGALDYREKAPLEASKTMYLDKNGEPNPKLSREGSLAVGVPGTVAGMFQVNEKFGTLSMAKLLKPSIDLAKRGFMITAKQANMLNRFQENFLEINKDSILFSRQFAKGDTLKNYALANTLERISENGLSEFYGGHSGQILIEFLSDYGGIMSLKDLEEYHAVWRQPIEFDYKNLKVISMPPPSSGGIVLGQILKTLEAYDLKQLGHNSIKYIQLLTEAERRAYADRSFYLGDPDFVDIPVDSLLDSEYLKQRMISFSFEEATNSKDIEHGEITGYENDETTHYSIVDQYGNAIAATTTLNGAYGSKLYSSELGFFLNNEMDDFSTKPGVPNMFGLIGAEANAIAPGKRMLSSMTPTIVEKDGDFWMSVGTPGGSTIITSVLQTILNVSEFNMSMQEAVDAPRFHHQWKPDEITFETIGFKSKLLDSLSKRGYKVIQQDSKILGKVDGILRLPNQKLEGGADHRGDDTAVGF